LRVIQENFEEGYVKAKEKKKKRKKSGMKGECLSILKEKKVSIEERHSKCQKSTPKNQVSYLLVCL
jgi:hypothetical protein